MFFTVAMYASPDCHAADVGMSVRCWFLCRSCAFILPCNFNMKANYCYFITLQIKLNLYTFLNLQQLALSTIQSTTADCVAMTVTRHLLATIFFSPLSHISAAADCNVRPDIWRRQLHNTPAPNDAACCSIWKDSNIDTTVISSSIMQRRGN